MRFWQELKERRMVQVVLSYIGLGWVVLEVVSQLVERSVLPNMVYQVALIWVVAGLPAALLIGWHHGEKGKQKAPVSELLLLAMFSVLALGASGVRVSRHITDKKLAASAENPLELRRIAVRYFEDLSGDGRYQHVADGLTESLIDELSRVDALEVVSRNGVRQFRGADDVSADSVGRALDAGTVIEGTVEPRGDELRVELRFVDGQSGATIRRASFSEPADSLLRVEGDVTEQAANALRAWIGAEVRLRRTAATTSSSQAWALLQRAEKRRKDAEDHFVAGDYDAADSAFDEADELLGQAERADSRWVDPIAARAAIAYRRAYLMRSDPASAEPYIDEALGHADRALAAAPTNARALEVRGTASYLKWLLRITPDPAEQDHLYSTAKEDLRAAVRYDGGLASAYATLSHLYFREDDIPDAVVAATKAMEEDAYLDNANVVLWRLFNASLDLGNFTPAIRWCDEGARRYPDDYRFVTCQLRLMTTPAATPDPARAWTLLARQDSLTPAQEHDFQHLGGEMLVGGILARAAQLDSARAVLDRAAAADTPELDPQGDLGAIEAYMRILAGQKPEAMRLLKRAKAAAPEQFEMNGEVPWWWRDLQDQPDYRSLFNLN